MKLSAAAILSLAGLASAEVYLKEQFDDVSSFWAIPTRRITIIKYHPPGHFFDPTFSDPTKGGSTSSIAFVAEMDSTAML